MIDESAVIPPDAKLGEGVEVGAFSVIGADVEIGNNCRIAPHVVIEGPTKIGDDCEFFQFSSIGAAPQHKGHKGEPTRVEIGDRNIFREYVSIHRGTMIDEGVTSVGNDNMLMAYCHLAHDVRLGNNITMANNASFAGHARIGDNCIFGGFALVYQFTRIGEGSFIGFGSGVNKDIPPYVMASVSPVTPNGVNSEGLRRRGHSKDEIKAVREAYKLLYRSNLRLVEAKEKIAELAEEFEVLVSFRDFLNDMKHGLAR